jgi:hypothetical protein
MHSSLACCLLAAAVPAACAFSSSPLPLTSRLYVTPRHAATAPASSAFGSLEHFIRHQPRVAALGGSPRLRGAARPGPAMAVESAPAGVPKAAGAAGKLAAADSEAPGAHAPLPLPLSPPALASPPVEACVGAPPHRSPAPQAKRPISGRCLRSGSVSWRCVRPSPPRGSQTRQAPRRDSSSTSAHRQRSLLRGRSRMPSS